jgi:hypothetical protein
LRAGAHARTNERQFSLSCVPIVIRTARVVSRLNRPARLGSFIFFLRFPRLNATRPIDTCALGDEKGGRMYYQLDDGKKDKDIENASIVQN